MTSPTGVRRRPSRLVICAAVVAGWVALWTVLQGRATLALATFDTTALHDRLTGIRDWVDAHRASSAFFTGFIDVIRTGVDRLATLLQELISQPAFGRPVPLVGWLGVVALATFVGYAFANLRIAVLTAAGLVGLGLLGLWPESMDTLAMTMAAVLLSLAVGIPLGIYIGVSRRARRIATPVLDVMQAMPTFVYLAPLTLFFLIGPGAAVIATLIYAMPPIIRLTAHGLRQVGETALEAGRAHGATRWQILRTVQLPLAKRTIIVGVNQTTMAALSMVVIAALIDAPGLGNTVVRALSALDVGRAFTGGLAIVIMAVVLDRLTTAASVRVEQRYRASVAARPDRARRWTTIGLGAGAVVACYLAATYYWAAEFPGTGVAGGYLTDAVNAIADWSRLHLYAVTSATTDAVTYGLINPLQALLAQSPWYLVCATVLALTWTLAGARAMVVAAVCLMLLLGTGLWQAAMVTLTSTVVATLLVIALGVVFGVLLARSPRLDLMLRPVLDAAQVMPPFVYLAPFLGLFGSTRLTAIIAAVVFAGPVAVKIIADGVSAVPPAVVEAATASGASPWQIITRVQLPMARHAVVLAANQGLIYVLSVVVIGGLVGAGALGYLVVAGVSQGHLYGKGLAAGVAIVLMGVLLDRVTQAAARRAGAPQAAARGHSAG